MRKETQILGTDMRFPITVNARGDIDLISGAENLRQAIIDNLETFLTEAIYHEEYGSELIKYVHRNCNQNTATQIAFLAKQNLMKFETRLASIEITGTAVPSDDATEPDVIMLDANYTDITYHNSGNFTYPFVLGKDRDYAKAS